MTILKFLFYLLMGFFKYTWKGWAAIGILGTVVLFIRIVGLYLISKGWTEREATLTAFFSLLGLCGLSWLIFYNRDELSTYIKKSWRRANEVDTIL